MDFSISSDADAARRIVDVAMAAYDGSSDFRTGAQADWEPAHLRIVEARARALERDGWTRLGDAVLAPRAIGAGVNLLLLASPDGQSLAQLTVGVVKAGFLGDEMGLVVAVLSEVGDGSWIETVNAAGGILTSAPAVQRLALPMRTELSLVIAAHDAALQPKLAAGLAFTRVRSADDALAMLRRQIASTVAFRRSIGWITPQELVARGASDDLIRLVEREKRARRRASGDGWAPPSVVDAARDLLAARETALDDARIRMLDALAETGEDPGAIARALSAAGTMAETLLVHALEGSHAGASWPSWDVEALRLALWPIMSSRTSFLIAALATSHATTRERALRELALLGAAALPARDAVLARLLAPDWSERWPAIATLGAILAADASDDVLRPFLDGKHGCEGVDTAVLVIRAGRLMRHAPDLRTILATESGDALATCGVLRELSPGDPAILPALEAEWTRRRSWLDEDAAEQLIDEVVANAEADPALALAILLEATTLGHSEDQADELNRIPNETAVSALETLRERIGEAAWARLIEEARSRRPGAAAVRLDVPMLADMRQLVRGNDAERAAAALRLRRAAWGDLIYRWGRDVPDGARELAREALDALTSAGARDLRHRVLLRMACGVAPWLTEPQDFLLLRRGLESADPDVRMASLAAARAIAPHHPPTQRLVAQARRAMTKAESSAHDARAAEFLSPDLDEGAP